MLPIAGLNRRWSNPVATQTSPIEAFFAANPTDARVVRIVKLLDKPVTGGGKLGKLIGALMREEGL